MADQTAFADQGTTRSGKRPLPVVRWLQWGTVAAGVGLAMAAAPAIASADDSSSAAASDTAKPATPHRPAATGRRSVSAAASAASTRNIAHQSSAAVRPASVAPVVAVVAARTADAAVPAVSVATDRFGGGAAMSGTTVSRGTNPSQNFVNGLGFAVNSFATGWLNLVANPGTPAEFGKAAQDLTQRSFFDQLPTATAEADVYRASGEVDGRIVTQNAEGDAVTYKVKQAPANGSVQVSSDGQFAYTPNAGYDGADSFTVEVADPGVDLANPAKVRAQAVKVDIGPPNVGIGTNGFNIFNLTGRATMITQIAVITGDPISQADLNRLQGKTLMPGDSVHLELDNPVWGVQQVQLFMRTADASRGLTQTDWTVYMLSTATETPTSKCLQGNCWSLDGKTIAVVDPAGTKWDFKPNDVWGQYALRGLLRAYQTLGNMTFDYAGSTFTRAYVNKPVPTAVATNLSDNDTITIERSVSVTDEETNTSAWDIGLSLGLPIAKAVDVAVAKHFGKATTESTTYSTTVRYQPFAWSFSVIQAAVPQIRTGGDVRVSLPADTEVTFSFRDVNYVAPDPTNPKDLEVAFSARNEPLQPAVNGQNKGFQVSDTKSATLDPRYIVGQVDSPQLQVLGFEGKTVANQKDFAKERGVVYTMTSLDGSPGDPGVVSVDQSGKVTILKAGWTRVTATYSWVIEGVNSGSVSAYMDVQVCSEAGVCPERPTPTIARRASAPLAAQKDHPAPTLQQLEASRV